MKELTPPREGLLAATNDLHEHPRGHSSWRESTTMKLMNIQLEYSKMDRNRVNTFGGQGLF